MSNNNIEPIFNILPINFQPQQKEYLFDEDNIKFSSKFDSGNMLKAERHLNSSTVKINLIFFIFILSTLFKLHLIAMVLNKNIATKLGSFFLLKTIIPIIKR